MQIPTFSSILTVLLGSGDFQAVSSLWETEATRLQAVPSEPAIELWVLVDQVGVSHFVFVFLKEYLEVQNVKNVNLVTNHYMTTSSLACKAKSGWASPNSTLGVRGYSSLFFLRQIIHLC